MVLRWLAGARTVITVAVLLAAGVLVLTTLVTRRRLIRAAEIRSVLSMGGPVTGNALRDVLRTLTGDPDLDVYYRLPHREEYVTSDGEPAPWRDRIGGIRAVVARGDGSRRHGRGRRDRVRRPRPMADGQLAELAIRV